MSKQTQFCVSWKSFHCFEVWLKRKIRTSEMLLNDNLEALKGYWNFWSATKYEVVSQAGTTSAGTNSLRVLNTTARCFPSNVLRNTLFCYRSFHSWVIKRSKARTCRNSEEKPSFPRCISRLSMGTCNMAASHEQEDVGYLWPLTV